MNTANKLARAFAFKPDALADFVDRIIMAEDYSPGQLSSSEMARFKGLPPSHQNAIIERIKKIRRLKEQGNLAKAQELQAELDRMTGDEEPGEHAAGVLFVAPDGDVLVLQRGPGEENYAGHWSLPGGKAEDGESPEEAATRECEEEMGGCPDGPKKLLDRQTTPRGLTFHTFVQPVQDKFEPQLNGEHSDYQWASLGDLPQPMHPGVAETLRSKLGGETSAEDMTPEDWAGLREGLLKFLDEEEVEPEHAEDEKFIVKVLGHSDIVIKEVPIFAPTENEALARVVKSKIKGAAQYYVAKAAQDEFSERDRAGQDSKLSQAEVSYGIGKGKTKCANCEYFLKEEEACQLVEDPIELSGWCKLFTADRITSVKVDRAHDGPWISCMSKDGQTMYINRNLAATVDIDGKTVLLDEELLAHELPEWDEIQELLAEFEKDHERKPKTDERKAIYLRAHHVAGTPGEREYCQAKGIDWAKLSAWFRGEEDRIEHLKVTRPPKDADVKPIKHGHGDLEVTGDELGGANSVAHPAKKATARGELAANTGVTGGPPTHKAGAGGRVVNGRMKLSGMEWPSNDEASFHEEDHPRKAGQFATKGSGSSGAKKEDKPEETGEKDKSEKKGKSLGEHAEGAAARFIDNQADDVATGVVGFLKKHGKGVLAHHLNHSTVLPAIHASVGFALEHLGASIPETAAVTVVGYAIHQVMHHFGLGPEKAVELMVSVASRLAKTVMGAHEYGKMLSELDLHKAGRDEKPDEIATSLRRMIRILKNTVKDLVAAGEKYKPEKPEQSAKDEALQLALDRCIAASGGGEVYALDFARPGSVREYDADGHLHISRTPISKANVCPYMGKEIPNAEELGLELDKVYQLLRHPDELKKGAATSNGKPFMRKHEPVSSDDHKPYDVIGATGNDAEWEEPYLYNSVVVWPQEDIDKIESEEKVELSSGYRYVADMTPGIYKGVKYDGVMRDIVFNHLASVEEGRVGKDVRVLDSVNKNVGWAAIEAAILVLKEPVT